MFQPDETEKLAKIQDLLDDFAIINISRDKIRKYTCIHARGGNCKHVWLFTVVDY